MTKPTFAAERRCWLLRMTAPLCAEENTERVVAALCAAIAVGLVILIAMGAIQ